MLLRFFLVFVILYACSGPAWGQASPAIDTSLLLEAVEVKDSRLSVFGIGRKQEQYRTAELLAAQSLGQLLSQSTLIHIKNYGPAQLSTTSFRGGSASHTALLWNGLNIDNTMLGQTDLSLLPTALFEEVSVRYGGESAFWGSGAVSGSLHLNNDLSTDEASSTFVQLGGNTIGGYDLSGKGKWGGKKSKHALRLWYQQSENNFFYTNDLGKRLRQSHAAFRTRALLQDNRFVLRKNEWLDVHLWMQDTHREIPPTKSQAGSQAVQEDRALRLMSQWKKVSNRNSWEGRLAWMEESLDYTDAPAAIFSESRIRTFISQGAFTHHLYPGHLLQANVQARFPKVNSNNYREAYSETQLGVSLSYKIDNWIKNWQLLGSLRQEWNGNTRSPFLVSLQAQGALLEDLELKASLSRNYRFPTFNERFYEPGGLPDIQPESGWSQEAGIGFKGKNWSVAATAFSRLIDNWILWLPEGNYFSPKNIEQVWSRGLESRVKLNWPLEKGQWSLSLAHDYVRSTNQKERFAGSATQNKQLIYVPLHKGAATLSFEHPRWFFSYQHSITGTVYTLPDHSAGLPGFHLGRLEARYQLTSGQMKAQVFVIVHNTWNSDYELVVNRAMPGRYLQAGINVRIP